MLVFDCVRIVSLCLVGATTTFVFLSSPHLSSASENKPSAVSADAANPGDVFKDCEICPEMVVIPQGRFTMGTPQSKVVRDDDEGPRHDVSISYAFGVSKFEITNAQFGAFADTQEVWSPGGCRLWQGNGMVSKWVLTENADWRDPGFEALSSSPVACVNWNDAQAYIAWLSALTGRTYRLLSEAEWEYAARASTDKRFHFGNAYRLLCQYGNTADRQMNAPWASDACDDGFGARTSPVGSFAPNSFGLFDLNGNVWEWVEDCWNDSYRGAPNDGEPWLDGDCGRRVSRGGAWDSVSAFARNANRRWNPIDYRVSNTGFRVARDLGAP